MTIILTILATKNTSNLYLKKMGVNEQIRSFRKKHSNIKREGPKNVQPIVSNSQQQKHLAKLYLDETGFQDEVFTGDYPHCKTDGNC